MAYNVQSASLQAWHAELDLHRKVMVSIWNLSISLYREMWLAKLETYSIVQETRGTLF